MCPPIIAAIGGASSLLGAGSLALTAASGVASAVGAVTSYKQGVQQAEQTSQAAVDSYILETHLLNKRKLEERTATAQRLSDNSLRRMKGEASAITAAASGGVQGNSVEQVLADFYRNENVTSDRLKQSQEAQDSQIGYQMRGLEAKTKDRINSIPVPSVGDLFGTLAKSAGSIVGGFSDFKDQFDGDYEV